MKTPGNSRKPFGQLQKKVQKILPKRAALNRATVRTLTHTAQSSKRTVGRLITTPGPLKGLYQWAIRGSRNAVIMQRLSRGEMDAIQRVPQLRMSVKKHGLDFIRLLRASNIPAQTIAGTNAKFCDQVEAQSFKKGFLSPQGGLTQKGKAFLEQHEFKKIKSYELARKKGRTTKNTNAQGQQGKYMFIEGVEGVDYFIDGMNNARPITNPNL